VVTLEWRTSASGWSRGLLQVRERESLNGKTEEDKSERKRDHGQLNKWKNPSINALDHLMGKKDRHTSEALKM
jgi:hypothetical protein